MNTATTLYPAIDLRGGHVVRLHQGDYAQETRYPQQPLALAREYAHAGAGWLHLVNLDGARDGGLATTLALIGELATLLDVQTGGGVRSRADVAALLDAGARRVVLGSVALREPQQVAQWLTEFGPERLVIALDTRWDGTAWRLPSQGWTQMEAATLDELAVFYAQAGARHLLCTDIARDGTLAGPNLALYRHLQALAPSLAVQASGGMRDLADVQALRALGVAGVVLGKSLLEGRLNLREALVSSQSAAPAQRQAKPA